MTASNRPTLLVGSVNLGSAERVFTTAGEILGGSLRSMPDGETGGRLAWIGWQRDVLERASFLRRSAQASADAYEGSVRDLARYRVHGDLSGARFDKLGYADAAIDSYRIFIDLRDQGKIPAGVRFQVSMPTPIAPLAAMIEPDDFVKVEALYEEAMRREIGAICEAIPADDLAMQWDVSLELAIIEGVAMQDGKSLFPNPRNDMTRRIAKVVDWVPGNVALGIHLCYGDYDHKHWKEPKDTGLMVEIANTLCALISRKLDWLHMPVPINRDDDAYFAPLAELKLPKGTQLYLGLVHRIDGLEGGKRRMKTAERHISGFGIATECGMGRRPPETIPDVMKLMSSLAAV